MQYDQLLDLLKTRRSIRRFEARPVPRAEVQRLLEAARWAPSNHNRQPWKFLVLEDHRQIQALAEQIRNGMTEKLKGLPEVAAAYANELTHYATFFQSAPLLVVTLHKQPICVGADVWRGVKSPALVSGEPISAAMAVQNLLLAAHALGLGACVLTAPLMAPEAIANALPIPAGFDCTCFIALGYPAESPPAPRRKNLEHIAEFLHNPASDV